MRNETDLDWLARNVHKWPDPALKSVFGPQRFVLDVFDGESHVTHHQWLARRAELQNKPRWADAPAWAEWLAQDCRDGLWIWLEIKPDPGSDENNGWSIDPLGDYAGAGRGEVLGDWRDTLERRPVDNVVDATLPSDAVSWFERGELPPVGYRLQWRPGSVGHWEHDSWIDVDVIAHAGDGDIVIKWDGEAGNNKQLVAVGQEIFRPLPTERQRTITGIVDIMIGTPANDNMTATERFTVVAGAIYDKYLSKQEPTA